MIDLIQANLVAPPLSLADLACQKLANLAEVEYQQGIGDGYLGLEPAFDRSIAYSSGYCQGVLQKTEDLKNQLSNIFLLSVDII